MTSPEVNEVKSYIPVWQKPQVSVPDKRSGYTTEWEQYAKKNKTSNVPVGQTIGARVADSQKGKGFFTRLEACWKEIKACYKEGQKAHRENIGAMTYQDAIFMAERAR